MSKTSHLAGSLRSATITENILWGANKEKKSNKEWKAKLQTLLSRLSTASVCACVCTSPAAHLSALLQTPAHTHSSHPAREKREKKQTPEFMKIFSVIATFVITLIARAS